MAISKYDYEQMVDALLDILRNNLPAAIAEINAEKADAFVLTDPIAYHFGFRHVDTQKNTGNSVVVVNTNMVEGISFNPGFTDEDLFIDSIIIYWDSKAEVVERKILRYAKAMRKVLDTEALWKDVTPKPENIGDSVISLQDFLPSDFEGDIYFKQATIRLKIRNVFTYDN